MANHNEVFNIVNHEENEHLNHNWRPCYTYERRLWNSSGFP